MEINEILGQYEKQAEKLENKLNKLNLKEDKSYNDYQRLGIIQGQLMIIDTVIDDLMILSKNDSQINFRTLMISLKKGYLKHA
ncbi:MAG TPA: hypothetical protein DEQ24_03705 [Enterococcus sp.]|nr:hypothetical protein [Enterococcus sp.]